MYLYLKPHKQNALPSLCTGTNFQITTEGCVNYLSGRNHGNDSESVARVSSIAELFVLQVRLELSSVTRVTRAGRCSTWTSECPVLRRSVSSLWFRQRALTTMTRRYSSTSPTPTELSKSLYFAQLQTSRPRPMVSYTICCSVTFSFSRSIYCFENVRWNVCIAYMNCMW